MHAFLTIYLKPLLSYIRPLLLFLTNHTLHKCYFHFCTAPIIVFTLFTHVFMMSLLCNHINSLLSQHFSTCKQLTKILGSKRPAVDWLIVVYCSSVNFTISMQLWASIQHHSEHVNFAFFPSVLHPAHYQTSTQIGYLNILLLFLSCTKLKIHNVGCKFAVMLEYHQF